MDQEDQRWICVGNVDDFPEGEKIEKVVNRTRILVLRQQDRWHAFEALCPHMSRSLQHSRVDGNVLECIWHNMRFDLESGAIVYASGFIGIPDLKIYKIRVDHGVIYVRDVGDPLFTRLSQEVDT